MTKFKRFLLLAAIATAVAVNIFIYLNAHLCYRAKEETESPEKKIRILKRANLFYPSNNSAYYELGKAHFDLGMENLNDKALSTDHFQRSIRQFTRSLRINPASYFCHFNLAQSLLYMGYLDPAFEVDSYEEYKKAALLAGHNSQIYYEVGKIFLSLWPKLEEEDRNFALKTLKKILERKDRQMIQTVMHIWEMNVREYRVMEAILPENASIYNLYAEFLGEKSLSCEERQMYLAKAERLEFERARNEHDSGEGKFQYYWLKKASQDFLSCLRRLERIRFYQNLIGRELIDVEDYLELKKSANLNVAKCILEEGQDFERAQAYLYSYLALEDEVAPVRELETFLGLRGFAKKKLGASFDDLGRLYFQTLLYFKQNRYRDIVRVGRLLEQSFVVVPEEKKEEYVKVLQLVGDSYQKVDYLYDAGGFYRRALEFEPGNLETLLRIRQNYERLNEEEQVQEIDEKIESLLAPRQIEIKRFKIEKGQRSAHTLILDGSEIILDLNFCSEEGSRVPPMISVFFNGRVVWEEYLKKGEGMGQNTHPVLSLPLRSKVGENSLVVIPVNTSIELHRMTYRKANS